MTSRGHFTRLPMQLWVNWPNNRRFLIQFGDDNNMNWTCVRTVKSLFGNHISYITIWFFRLPFQTLDKQHYCYSHHKRHNSFAYIWNIHDIVHGLTKKISLLMNVMFFIYLVTNYNMTVWILVGNDIKIKVRWENGFIAVELFILLPNTPILKVWSCASRAQRYLTLRGTSWRNNGAHTWDGFCLEHHIYILSGEYWHSRGEIECRVIFAMKTDLSGFFATMHSGLCE